MTAPPLALLVPVLGCLPGSEPATCPRTQLAGRNFTPASTTETERKSSAGPEPPTFDPFCARGTLPTKNTGIQRTVHE